MYITYNNLFFSVSVLNVICDMHLPSLSHLTLKNKSLMVGIISTAK